MTTPTPYAPAPPPPRHRPPGGVVWPSLLIIVGSIFLLQNLGLLPADAWTSLWRLWPLVLVLIGLELLLGHRLHWLALGALTVGLFAVGLIATMLTQSGASPASRAASVQTRETALGGASQAVVTVRFGAGQLTLGPLINARPDQLSAMTFQGPTREGPNVHYSVTDGTGRLEYQVGGAAPRFPPFFRSSRSAATRLDVNLAPSVPITSLNIQTGATDARLDLAQLRVSSLDLSIGAASTWVRLPEAAGTTTAHISGGAASLTIEVPAGVAAQIRHRGGLSTLDIDQARFPSVGEGLYRSPDYETAHNRVDITLETGVATIHVS